MACLVLALPALIPFIGITFCVIVTFSFTCFLRCFSCFPFGLFKIFSICVNTVVIIWGICLTCCLLVFSDMACSILPHISNFSSSSFLGSPSSEHQMAFGSGPSTLIPFNTTTLSFRVTRIFTNLKALSSINPFRLMNILVVLVNTVV